MRCCDEWGVGGEGWGKWGRVDFDGLVWVHSFCCVLFLEIKARNIMCSFMFHVYICRTCMYVSLIYIYDGKWKMEDCKNCKLYHRTVNCK